MFIKRRSGDTYRSHISRRRHRRSRAAELQFITTSSGIDIKLNSKLPYNVLIKFKHDTINRILKGSSW